MEESRQSRIIYRLKASYANRNDTLTWALMVWSVSAVALRPFMPYEATLERSIIVAVVWSAVHLLRRM